VKDHYPARPVGAHYPDGSRAQDADKEEKKFFRKTGAASLNARWRKVKRGGAKMPLNMKESQPSMGR